MLPNLTTQMGGPPACPTTATCGAPTIDIMVIPMVTLTVLGVPVHAEISIVEAALMVRSGSVPLGVPTPYDGTRLRQRGDGVVAQPSAQGVVELGIPLLHTTRLSPWQLVVLPTHELHTPWAALQPAAPHAVIAPGVPSVLHMTELPAMSQKRAPGVHMLQRFIWQPCMHGVMLAIMPLALQTARLSPLQNMGTAELHCLQAVPAQPN